MIIFMCRAVHYSIENKNCNDSFLIRNCTPWFDCFRSTHMAFVLLHRVSFNFLKKNSKICTWKRTMRKYWFLVHCYAFCVVSDERHSNSYGKFYEISIKIALHLTFNGIAIDRQLYRLEMNSLKSDTMCVCVHLFGPLKMDKCNDSLWNWIENVTKTDDSVNEKVDEVNSLHICNRWNSIRCLRGSFFLINSSFGKWIWFFKIKCWKENMTNVKLLFSRILMWIAVQKLQTFPVKNIRSMKFKFQ